MINAQRLVFMARPPSTPDASSRRLPIGRELRKSAPEPLFDSELQLAHALARDSKVPADLAKACRLVAEEPMPQDVALARWQRRLDRLDRPSHQMVAMGLHHFLL